MLGLGIAGPECGQEEVLEGGSGGRIGGTTGSFLGSRRLLLAEENVAA